MYDPKNPHVRKGDAVELLIAGPGEAPARWVAGFRVISVHPSPWPDDDRPYRISMASHAPGRSYRHCAPECVRASGGGA